MTWSTRLRVAATAVLLVILGWSTATAAHTGTDLVAAPAGSQATMTLQPTHGCGQSPTVAVSIRAPLRGASAGEVTGWTATATDDEDGTVLEWTGGVLPADQAGQFPVTFTVPDDPGLLLRFPSVQACRDGRELAWINGDPTAEHPAPRLLVLPAGEAAAATVDEVPPAVPGREQLVEVVDVDNPGAEAAGGTGGGGAGGATTTTAAGPDSRAGEAGGAAPAVAAAVTEDGDGGGDGTPLGVAAIVAAAAVVVTVVVFLVRRRSHQPQ